MEEISNPNNEPPTVATKDKMYTLFVSFVCNFMFQVQLLLAVVNWNQEGIRQAKTNIYRTDGSTETYVVIVHLSLTFLFLSDSPLTPCCSPPEIANYLRRLIRGIASRRVGNS